MLRIIKSRFGISSILLHVLSILFFSSCNDSNKIYIISIEDSIYKAAFTRNDGIVLAPPSIPIGDCTFLVDSNCHFYYYSFLPEPTLGMVGDDIYNENKHLGIMPNNIFTIPYGQEEEFFLVNVRSSPKKPRHKNVVIASAKDTIIGDFVPFLKKIKKDSSEKITIFFRRMLKEEKVVLKYKLDGKYEYRQ